MTKEKIIKMLNAYIDKAKHEVKVCTKYNKGNPDYESGKLKAYKEALLLVEAMHDDEYWNEAIAGAIAMGDR